MTGPEHYRRVQELAAEAHKLLGIYELLCTTACMRRSRETAFLSQATRTAGRSCVVTVDGRE